MRGETEERPKKRRKKKSKFGYYLYAIVVLLLTITNITLATLLLTHVQEIEVNGAEITSEEEVKSWITEDPLTVNSLYTFFKYKFGSHELPIHLNDMKVSLKAPWKLKVDIEEKEIIASAFYRKSYVYFDKDGFVMKMSEEQDASVPKVEGLPIRGAEVFKYLNVKEEKVFPYVESIIAEVEKTELQPTRIVWDDGMNLYFDEVCVELGKSNYDVKLAELPPILETLTGKKGVLRMEYYSQTGDSISFVEEGVVEEVSDEVIDQSIDESVEETTEG